MNALRQNIRHSASQWHVLLVLTLVWVLLWGEVNAFNILSGALIAFVVLAVFPLPQIAESIQIRPIALTRLLVRFAYDVVVASIQVAAQALWFGHHPMNAVIEVRLRSHSDLFTTLTAELTSLVPGSLLIEVDPVGNLGVGNAEDRNVLFVHVFDVHDLDDVEVARNAVLDQERRVVEALATDADLEAYRLLVEEDESR